MKLERRVGGARRSRHAPARRTTVSAMALATLSPARRAAHAVVLRTLADGAYADRALHGEARGLDARDRALAKQLAFGTVQRRLTLDHVIAAPRRPRARARACAPRCSSGSSSSCSSTAWPPTPRSARRSSWPSPAPATGSSTPCCAACSARAPSCPPTRRPRARRSATRIRAGWSSCGGTGSAPTRPARCWRPTTSPPSSRCASTPWSTTTSTTSPDAARARRSSSTGRSTRSPTPATRRARSPRSRAPASSWRARSPRSRASASSTCARRPAARPRTWRRSWRARARSSRSSATPQRARALQATSARMQRGQRHRASTADAKAYDGAGRFDRVLLDPPCSGLGTLRSHPDLRWRTSPRGDRAAGRRAGRAAGRRAPRAGARRDARLLGLHALAARGAARPATTSGGPSRTRRHRRLLYCPRWRLTSGCECPSCGEPWLRPSNLAGRYRCVNCLHRFELRSVCPDCGEHSTIVRMSSTAIAHLQPLRRLDARRGMTPPRRPLDPGRRLRPPARAGAARSSTPAREVIHVDVMDGHFVPAADDGPAGRRGAARASTSLLDVHLMIERPERHVADFAAAGADNITVHAEATPHVHYGRAGDPRGRLHRRRRAHPGDAGRGAAPRSAASSTWRCA